MPKGDKLYFQASREIGTDKPDKKMLSTIFITFFVSFLFACTGQSRKPTVGLKPAFTELESIVNSEGKNILYKDDYYLVDYSNIDRIQLKHSLDSIVATIVGPSTNQYENYLLMFYKVDDDLNQGVIDNTKAEYQYKIFDEFKNSNFVISYYYRSGKYFDSDWGPNFD